MKGKSPDDFVFTTAARSTSSASLRWTGGRPIHAGDFSDQRWLPALKAAKAGGFAKRFTPHDLRHTHVAWLKVRGVASDASLDGFCDRAALRGLGFRSMLSAP
jgi:integrase